MDITFSEKLKEKNEFAALNFSESEVGLPPTVAHWACKIFPENFLFLNKENTSCEDWTNSLITSK